MRNVIGLNRCGKPPNFGPADLCCNFIMAAVVNRVAKTMQWQAGGHRNEPFKETAVAKSSIRDHGETRTMIFGRLPVAADLPHADLSGADNRLRLAETLREKLASAGIRPGESVMTHCNGGGRASLAALRAGCADVGAYYFHFLGWASDESSPIER